MDIIKPLISTSPISGKPTKPIIKTNIIGDKEVTEAHYFDPASGTFIRKGIVSIKDAPRRS